MVDETAGVRIGSLYEVPDFDAINQIKLVSSPSVAVAPQAVTNTTVGSAAGISLGNGIVYYKLTQAMDGSADNITINIPKPHRFLRMEATQTVTATGALDATGITLVLKRQFVSSSAPTNLIATNGAQAVSGVVLLGGTGWEAPGGYYTITATGQNLDTLTIGFYVQFLA